MTTPTPSPAPLTAEELERPTPLDVARLVIAARNVVYEDTPSREALRELDLAAEAFADRVRWDGEPEDAPSPPVQESR